MPDRPRHSLSRHTNSVGVLTESDRALVLELARDHYTPAAISAAARRRIGRTLPQPAVLSCVIRLERAALGLPPRWEPSPAEVRADCARIRAELGFPAGGEGGGGEP